MEIDFDYEYPALYYHEISGEIEELPRMSKPIVLGNHSTTLPEPEIEEDSIDLDVNEIRFTTDKAWLLDTQVGEAWFPKSKCTLDESNMSVNMPQWLYDKKF